VDLVSDCASANRFVSGYAAYSKEHVDFDAEEPLPPNSDVEPAPPSIPVPAAADVWKIAGGEVGIVNHPIVQITFRTCATLGCPNADETWIIRRPGEAPLDLRRHPHACSATFIAKNWLLTAAHCITPVALDTCMEHGDSLPECMPTWDTWGSWEIRGTRPNQTGIQRVQLWARAYVIGGWIGRNLLQNQLVCTTPDCYDTDVGANEDLALLYIPMDFDDELVPNVEANGAKRLSVGIPRADWQLAFYGWGLPVGTNPQTGMRRRVLRRGTDFFDTFNVLERRIEIGATIARPFACSGDSGGPMMHTGLELDTNVGIQQGLEAIVGVTSSAFPPCNELLPPGPGQAVGWSSVRVDHPEHNKFILDTMHRYPQYRNFSCKARGLAGVEAEECWGPPCTNNSKPEMGGCPLATQTCVNPGREFASKHKKFSCSNCNGTPQQGSCECIVGQCLSK
jgi:hypothetical protein